MKQNKFLLGLLPLLCGIGGLVLYMILLAAGRDDRGLLVFGHWAGMVLLVLSVLVLAGLFLLVRPLGRISRKKLFPRSILAAVGCWLAAAGVGYAGIRSLVSGGQVLTVIAGVLGILTAVCLVLTGIARLKGKLPGYGLYVAMTIFFMVRLIDLYRGWSAQPQLLEYLFSLMASIALMATGYQAAALPLGKGSRKWFVFFNRAALYFCCVSLAGSDPLFYLAMAVWTGTGLCATQEA